MDTRSFCCTSNEEKYINLKYAMFKDRCTDTVIYSIIKVIAIGICLYYFQKNIIPNYVLFSYTILYIMRGLYTFSIIFIIHLYSRYQVYMWYFINISQQLLFNSGIY